MSLSSTTLEGGGGGGKRPRETGGTNRRPNKADARTTLGSLLKYMEGYEVIVELKTGRRHRGKLASADDNMNLMLEEEETENNNGDSEKGDPSGESSTNAPLRLPLTRNIRGSKIRYLHFPDNANLPMLVKSGRERERNAAKKYQKTKRTRK
jgi:small nuclear ribonucleoprotein (snRNP)-like protein